jgi:hypothetical protein
LNSNFRFYFLEVDDDHRVGFIYGRRILLYTIREMGVSLSSLWLYIYKILNRDRPRVSWCVNIERVGGRRRVTVNTNESRWTTYGGISRLYDYNARHISLPRESLSNKKKKIGMRTRIWKNEKPKTIRRVKRKKTKEKKQNYTQRISKWHASFSFFSFSLCGIDVWMYRLVMGNKQQKNEYYRRSTEPPSPPPHLL